MACISNAIVRENRLKARSFHGIMEAELARNSRFGWTAELARNACFGWSAYWIRHACPLLHKPAAILYFIVGVRGLRIRIVVHTTRYIFRPLPRSGGPESLTEVRTTYPSVIHVPKPDAEPHLRGSGVWSTYHCGRSQRGCSTRGGRVNEKEGAVNTPDVVPAAGLLSCSRLCLMILLLMMETIRGGVIVIPCGGGEECVL